MHIPTDLIPLTKAATLVPGATGGRVHMNTIRRWAMSGVRGVKLRTMLVGGRRMTSTRWVREFLEHLTVKQGGI